MNSKFLCVLLLPAVLALAACAKSKDEASNPSNEGPRASVASNTANNESDETLLIKDLSAEKVELEFLNAEMLEKTLINAQDFDDHDNLKPGLKVSIITDGKLDLISNLDKVLKENSVACLLEMNPDVGNQKPKLQNNTLNSVKGLFEGAVDIDKNDFYIFDDKTRGMGLFFYYENAEIVLICTKSDEHTPFTVGEIRQALKGVVEVKINK